MEKRTTVLLIAEALGGGVRRHIVDLIENLDSEQFEIFLIYSIERADETFIKKIPELRKKAKLIECDDLVREIHATHDLQAFKQIKKYIKEIHPDVVHCHSSKAGVLGRLAAKQCKVKKIFYTPHAYSFMATEFSSIKKRAFVLIERFLSKHATTKTFNVSNGEKKTALDVKLDQPDKFEVIYNGIPDLKRTLTKEEVRQKLKLPIDAFIVGTTARMIQQKDPMTFMEIAKEVIAENPIVHFVYVGDGPMFEEISQFISKNQLTKNIHLLGFRDDATDLLWGYDLFMMTSLSEGLPYAPIEAMQVGIPILATNVTGNDEVVKNGHNGKLLNYENLITDAKLSILSFEEWDNNRIKSYFKNNFAISIMIKKIVAFYN